MTDSSDNALALFLAALGVDPDELEDTLEDVVGTRDIPEGLRRAKIVNKYADLEEVRP